MTAPHDHLDVTTERLCLGAGRPHGATVGHLCAHHADRLAADLRAVEAEAAALDARPTLARPVGGRGGGLASHRAPARLDVLAMTDRRRGTGRIGAADADDHGIDDTPSVLDVLGSWARLAREELGSPVPATPATVHGERDYLSRQLGRIAALPWVDELIADVVGLLRALQRANGTADLPVGRCETLVADAEECGGTIRHHVIEHDHGQDEPGFRCDRCRRVWTGTGALRLRDQLGRQLRAGTLSA